MNAPWPLIMARMFSGTGPDEGLTNLATRLGIPVETLLAALTDPRLCYRPFTIRKRDGGKRQIVAPSGALKLLQRRLLHQYLALQHVHDAATAFRSGSSIATHARRHVGQAIVLTVDLADFFPATAARRVRRWFGEQGWQGAALDVLMRLCVYRGGLPQGAPTSPALSNLVNYQLDEDLSELATLNGARYSRYCDDLAFSWLSDAEPQGFRVQVEGKLSRRGYEIQLRKGWRLKRIDERPEITGLVIDGRRLRLSERILQRIRRLQSHWWSATPRQREQLNGYLGLWKMLR